MDIFPARKFSFKGENDMLVQEQSAETYVFDYPHGCLPICASCKRIRNRWGQWHSPEESGIDIYEWRLTHGI